jgi:hypothetical protein
MGVEFLFYIIYNKEYNVYSPLGSVLSSDKKTYEVTQYTVSYFIGRSPVNTSMKYAQYGYIKENGDWIQTSKPVNLNNVCYVCNIKSCGKERCR